MLEGRACDTLQMETEARQGQGDPRAHLRGLGHAAARGEACACPGAVILWRSRSGNGECPLQANAGVRARAGGWALQSLGRAPDHREDGPTDAGRLPAPAARSASALRLEERVGWDHLAAPWASRMRAEAQRVGTHGQAEGPPRGTAVKGSRLLATAPVCPPNARSRGKATTDGDGPDQDSPSTGLRDAQGLHLRPGRTHRLLDRALGQ